MPIASPRQSKPGPRLPDVAGADAAAVSLTGEAYLPFPCVGDFLDIENLFPQLVLALGLALLIGNGLAWWKHRRGETPQGVENAQYRPGRVVFLLVVGALLTLWGAATLLT